MNYTSVKTIFKIKAVKRRKQKCYKNSQIKQFTLHQTQIT